jgi:hypothetical protein
VVIGETPKFFIFSPTTKSQSPTSQDNTEKTIKSLLLPFPNEVLMNAYTRSAFSPRQIISHLITFPLKPKNLPRKRKRKKKEFRGVMGDE